VTSAPSAGLRYHRVMDGDPERGATQPCRTVPEEAPFRVPRTRCASMHCKSQTIQVQAPASR
jgi:hypothetical protein